MSLVRVTQELGYNEPQTQRQMKTRAGAHGGISPLPASIHPASQRPVVSLLLGVLGVPLCLILEGVLALQLRSTADWPPTPTGAVCWDMLCVSRSPGLLGRCWSLVPAFVQASVIPISWE